MRNLHKIKEQLEQLKNNGVTHFKIPTTEGPNFSVEELINEINLFYDE